MKKFFILTVVVCLVAACKSPETVLTAKVEFQGALTKESSAGVIYIKGAVKNTGNAEARLVRIYISGRVTGWNFADTPDLVVGYSSNFTIPFADLDGRLARDVDPTQLTRRVEWDEK